MSHIKDDPKNEPPKQEMKKPADPPSKPVLTSTQFLEGMIMGKPVDVIVKIIGWTAPEQMKTAKSFKCYVSNDEGYCMLLKAWGHIGEALAPKLRLGSVSFTFSFKFSFQVAKFSKLKVKDFFPPNDPSKNNTDSKMEFEFDENATVQILTEDSSPYEEYSQDNKYPPLWRYFEDIQKWDKNLGLFLFSF